MGLGSHTPCTREGGREGRMMVFTPPHQHHHHCFLTLSFLFCFFFFDRRTHSPRARRLHRRGREGTSLPRSLPPSLPFLPPSFSFPQPNWRLLAKVLTSFPPSLPPSFPQVVNTVYEDFSIVLSLPPSLPPSHPPTLPPSFPPSGRQASVRCSQEAPVRPSGF